MNGRVLGATLALLALGVGGGFAAGILRTEDPAPISSATPVPASNPSYPVQTLAPYGDDVGFPTLQPNLRYAKHELGDAPFAWSYRSPRGWLNRLISPGEIIWAPPRNPLGSYGLRVKLVNERKTPDEMVAQKLAALQDGYEDVTVIGRSDDTLAITYRAQPENWLRYNTFRWFTPAGSGFAEFEVSVTGRQRDRAGLTDLLDQVSASIRQE